MGMKGFDWATSNGMDNSRQRLVKSKQPINANTTAFEYFQVPVSFAANEELEMAA